MTTVSLIAHANLTTSPPLEQQPFAINPASRKQAAAAKDLRDYRQRQIGGIDFKPWLDRLALWAAIQQGLDFCSDSRSNCQSPMEHSADGRFIL
jgi:hypothetical protein